MQNKKLIFNSISAIVQVLIVGIIYFLLYRYLKETIGIKLFGVWSLVIATTSLALIANFGISTSIIKFVSTYYTRKDFEKLKKLIFTASVFIIIAYTLISILIFFLGNLILSYFIEPDYLSIALEILPYSLISLVINALGGVISSCLDGIQKNYIRSYILSFSSIILFILSLLWTPTYGLKGLIYAQIFQAVIVLFISLYFISKYIKGVLTLKWNWSKEIFKEIINYGLKMQALSFMQMSFEPITKAFLSRFGGLEAVGYYEMANRFVSQFRSLIVSANQVLIPVVAEAKETNESYVKELYLKTFSIIYVLDVLLVSGLIISIPIVSYFWVGEIIPFFMFAVIINSMAVFVNIISNPAYFTYLGEGKLNWLILSYLSVTILNIVAGYLLGHYLLNYGVILGWNLAFLSGSLIIIFSYHKSNAIKWKEVFNISDIILLIVATFTTYIGYNLFLNYFTNGINYTFLILFIFSIAVYLKLLISNRNFEFVTAKIKKLQVKNNE